MEIPPPAKEALAKHMAEKGIKIITEPKPAIFTCRWCKCKYEAPFNACAKHEFGGIKAHWWSRKTTPIYYKLGCRCPCCNEYNMIDWE